MRKLVLLSSALLLALSLAAVAQEEQKDAHAATAAKQERWEGMVVRASKDASTITVRKAGSILEREIHYDGSTKVDAQEHGSKKAVPIDPGNIKEGDRVICMGTYDPKGAFRATLISKRLSHSPSQ